MFIIAIINQIKIKITNEPLYISDIHFLTNIFNLIKLITTSISWKIILKFVFIFLIYGLFITFLIILGKKNDIELENKKARITIIILDIILMIILFVPNASSKNLFLKLFFNNDKFLDYAGYGIPLDYYNYYGCTAGIYGVYLNSYFFEPNDYDENLLNEQLSKFENTENNGELGTPNIIVIFSESFWDIEQLDEVKFNQKITPNFNNLKEKENFVNLISPSYGGMSENAAFELLTGGSLNYFPQGYIPIVSLYTRKNNLEIPSLVKVLKNNGYTTQTTFVEDYYNTEKSYKTMGFDKYIELNPDNKENYYNDEYLTNIIIKDLEKNKNKFFAVYSTYENHMPYYKDKYQNYDIEITESNLSESENNTLQAYAQGIYNSDKQLGRLYDYIQSIEEPTIILFLGDHLPFLLSSDYTNLIFKFDYFNTNDEKINLYRLYNTQSLILSNYNFENFNIPQYLGYDLLLNRIINEMNIKIPKYYKWLNSTYTSLAASNKYVSVDYEGNIFLTKNLKDKMEKMYKLKEKMQYKFFQKIQ